MLKFAVMKTLKIIIRLILVLFLLFIFNGLDCRLKVRKYTIGSAKITQPLKIVLITDLHSCRYGKGERRIIKKIDQFRPDIIMLGGDIFDDNMPFDRSTQLLNNIGPRYRCYYTTGNHEVWSGQIDSIKNIVRQSGVKLLDGEKETLKHGNDTLNICGWPDVTEHARWYVVWNGVDSLSAICNPRYYNILLHHRPEFVEKFMDYGFDLMLAGHYHGGQFRLPWMKEGVYAPDHAGTLKYTGGDYPFGNRHAIISRGLARESTLVPRFYIRPEIVEITIYPEAEPQIRKTIK